jgi:hypothetical protein
VATTSRTTPKARAPKVHFDIAAVEREVNDGERVEPFSVRLPSTGKVVTLKDPQLIGWQTASALTPEEPMFFLRTVVAEDDWEEFRDAEFSVATMRRLIEAWREHYNMPSLGE